MKNILVFLFLFGGCYTTYAQKKHAIYLDATVNGPGLSATYNVKWKKHWDIGGGVRAYFSMTYPKVYSACNVDVRRNWERKKSATFLFFDLGPAIYPVTRWDNTKLSPIGLFHSCGLGYQYKVNKRGNGPYASAAINGFYFRGRTLDSLYYKSVYAIVSLFLGLSVGFKI